MAENWGHFNEQQRGHMIDVSDKEATRREAVACGRLTMNPETIDRIKDHRIGKGDVLGVAQIAGIMAAKKTSDWIPMCHSLQLTGVDLSFDVRSDKHLDIKATVQTTGQTGVEMEALTAVSSAALTVYDMCKGIDKNMVIGPTYLESKTGGKSGNYQRFRGQEVEQEGEICGE